MPEEKVKPLSAAEQLLLHAFLGFLRDEPKSKERFAAVCDMLEGAIKAVKAKTRLDKLSKKS